MAFCSRNLLSNSSLVFLCEPQTEIHLSLVQFGFIEPYSMATIAPVKGEKDEEAPCGEQSKPRG